MTEGIVYIVAWQDIIQEASQPTTLLNEVEETDLHSRVEFLGFTFLTMISTE